MKKVLIAFTATTMLASLAMAADAPAEKKGTKAYSSRGETGGMDPVQPASGQKVDPKQVKKPAGTEVVPKAAAGKPEKLKGKAAIDETAGMDPPQANAGQKAQAKK